MNTKNQAVKILSPEEIQGLVKKEVAKNIKMFQGIKLTKEDIEDYCCDILLYILERPEYQKHKKYLILVIYHQLYDIYKKRSRQAQLLNDYAEKNKIGTQNNPKNSYEHTFFSDYFEPEFEEVLDKVSKHSLEIAQELIKEKTQKEIAEDLSLSISTVERTIEKLKEKLK